MTPPQRGRRSQPDTFLLDRLRKRRRQRARNRRKRFGRLVSGALIGTALFLVVSSFTGAAVWMSSCNLDSLNPVEVGENSFIFAADGSLLGSIPAERNRQPVGLDQISAWAPKATIAIEDRRFYEHGALDWLGIVRALYADIHAGRVVQGGSTITQQLVRNLYIKKKSQTLGRKATEACLAIKLAREKSKTWILDAYMNQVYYGNHAYGIEAAAQTYFSKPARKLSLTESALLAGLPQAPSVFDPFQRPGQAIARRDEVLRAMLANGNITSSQFADAVAQRKLHLKAGRLYTRIREPYFFSYVREELQRQYGANTVRSGGLKVYTTIDPRLQRLALAAIKRTLPYSTDPAAAIVSINPSNGAIRAMTEVSPGNPKNQVNIAYRLGVRTDLRTSDGVYVPSMGLGSRVVTPMDMASVYSTLAAGGIYSKPMAIRKVVLPGGKVDTEAGWGVPQRKRAVPDWVAAEVVRILEENMTHGTGVGAYFGGTSAGKTGTTDNYADAWFCGFLPGLEATIWIGYPKGELPMTSVHGIAVSGPTFPATIWKLFMERAIKYAPFPKEFPSPKTSPVWITHKLQYAMSGGYYYYTPSYSGSAQAQTTTGNGGADGFSQVPDS